MIKTGVVAGMIVATLAIFALMNRLYRYMSTPFLIPVLTTSVTLVVLLLVTGVPYETYMEGGKYIDALLGPAVVSLAYPLYKQRNVLQENLLSILSGVVAGTITGMISGLVFAKVIGVKKSLILTLLPKSVTTPVAMEISGVLGGNPSLTVVFVILAGFTGAVIGPYILKGTRMYGELNEGIALGSASHAIGTSKAFEYGPNAATVSSVAMALSAIFASVLGPLMVWVVYGM